MLTADSQFSSLWEDAVMRYTATAGKSAEGPIPRTIVDLLEAVENEHSRFSEFRGRRAKLRRCIQYALAPVEMLGDLTSGAAAQVRSQDIIPSTTDQGTLGFSSV